MPITVPCFYKKCCPLNSKILFVKIMSIRSQTVSVGGVFDVSMFRCCLAAMIPSEKG